MNVSCANDNYVKCINMLLDLKVCLHIDKSRIIFNKYFVPYATNRDNILSIISAIGLEV